jgi:hypothetical protein
MPRVPVIQAKTSIPRALPAYTRPETEKYAPISLKELAENAPIRLMAAGIGADWRGFGFSYSELLLHESLNRLLDSPQAARHVITLTHGSDLSTLNSKDWRTITTWVSRKAAPERGAPVEFGERWFRWFKRGSE